MGFIKLKRQKKGLQNRSKILDFFCPQDVGQDICASVFDGDSDEENNLLDEDDSGLSRDRDKFSDAWWTKPHCAPSIETVGRILEQRTSQQERNACKSSASRRETLVFRTKRRNTLASNR